MFVFGQKALGTALIQGGAFGMMFLLMPLTWKEKFKSLAIVGIVVVFALLAFYAVTGRVLTKAQSSRLDFTDPCNRYQGTGYQICNAYIAINLGGLTGVGIGASTQKYSYIPEPHTDMVFAVMAEEWGYIVCLVVLILYMIMLWRILMLASRANTIRGKYICVGIATYLFLHIFFNLGGLFAIIPLTGVPLPFLSYGGSFAISLLASLGVVQRIHIETKRHKIKF
jgi:cell division protein FtsW